MLVGIVKSTTVAQRIKATIVMQRIKATIVAQRIKATTVAQQIKTFDLQTESWVIKFQAAISQSLLKRQLHC